MFGFFEINLSAVYALWVRDIIRFYRSKSRIIGTLATPLLFMVFMGFGFSGSDVFLGNVSLDYKIFLVPGILGMTILFNSTFAGISVLLDKEFGFFKEVMIAPVSRISIVLGRIAGGTTITIFQSSLILFLSTLLWFKIGSLFGFILSLAYMFLMSVTFISIGLAFASRMKDMHGFNLIMNLFIFPLFFLSGALFPLNRLPEPIKIISYINPLTYGVDGLRASLTGFSEFSIMTSFGATLFFALIAVFVGAYFFEKSEYL
ncbi:MAG: ABC transporter permease [Candidatus Diapherotrites archaeon]|nr:ABC transporter permease [Candidatus Diapherotrites archaeon]